MPTTERKLNQFIIGESSDKGRSRTHNEDSSVIFEAMATAESGQTIPLTVAVVADGIGGNVAGGKASSLAAAEIEAALTEDATLAVTERLLKAVRRANARVYQSSIQDEALQGMGTTVVVAAIADDQLHLVHAGDSRAYLIRANKIYQLTKDHTWAQDALDSGRLTPEQAAKHPNRHVIKRYLGVAQGLIPDLEILLPSLYWEGGEESPPPTVESLTLEEEDVILLCSDGLTDVVDDATIQKVVDHNPAQFATEKLVDLANEEGGPDNITVAILAWRTKEPAAILPKPATLAPSEVQAAVTESAEATATSKSIFSPLGLVIGLLLLGLLSIVGLAQLAGSLPWSEREGDVVAADAQATEPTQLGEATPAAMTGKLSPTETDLPPTSTLVKSTATATVDIQVTRDFHEAVAAQAIVEETQQAESVQETVGAQVIPEATPIQLIPEATPTLIEPTAAPNPPTALSVPIATFTYVPPTPDLSVAATDTPPLSNTTIITNSLPSETIQEVSTPEQPLIYSDIVLDKPNDGEVGEGANFCWKLPPDLTSEDTGKIQVIFWKDDQDPQRQPRSMLGLGDGTEPTLENNSVCYSIDISKVTPHLKIPITLYWGVRFRLTDSNQSVHSGLLSDKRRYTFTKNCYPPPCSAGNDD